VYVVVAVNIDIPLFFMHEQSIYFARTESFLTLLTGSRRPALCLLRGAYEFC
jgi:hypothetical protein